MNDYLCRECQQKIERGVALTTCDTCGDPAESPKYRKVQPLNDKKTTSEAKQ